MALVLYGAVTSGEGTATVDGTAKTLLQLSLDTTALAQADQIHITNLSTTTLIRYYYGGATPTAAFGHILSPGSELYIAGRRSLDFLKLISASGSITISYTLVKL